MKKPYIIQTERIFRFLQSAFQASGNQCQKTLMQLETFLKMCDINDNEPQTDF